MFKEDKSHRDGNCPQRLMEHFFSEERMASKFVAIPS